MRRVTVCGQRSNAKRRFSEHQALFMLHADMRICCVQVMRASSCIMHGSGWGPHLRNAECAGTAGKRTYVVPFRDVVHDDKTLRLVYRRLPACAGIL